MPVRLIALLLALAVAGADVTVVATTLDSLVQQLIARPEIEKP